MKKIWKTLLAFSFVSCLFLVCTPKVNAAYNTKYLTREIPAGYYDSLDLNKTDEDFRRDLSVIISKNYNKHSYSTNNTVLAQTDPDPNNNGRIICLYTGQSLSSGSWNKEHVWAKSHGFGTESWDPYSDAHHLRPTLNSINSSRSNSDFGELDGVSGVKSDSYGNRWTSDTFEPRDEVKGDVARMMFYMATRYGFTAPYNLKLVNDAHTSISKTGNGRFGNLQTLLKWHYEDPVSDAEIYRNNVIYEDWQHNRNPYIDHPEYVDLAWPNPYSNQEVDQNKVTQAIELIAQIPGVVTIDHKSIVLAAKNAYDALNYNEKKLVTNYSQLEKAIETIAELEKPTTPVDPDDPDNPVLSNAVTVDFANHGLSNSGAYGKDFNGSINDKPFYFSNYGVFDSELRIGSNGKSASPITTVDAKYGLSSVTGVVLEQKFDVKNSKSVKLDISNKYGTLSEYYVLFNEIGTNTYSVVTHQSSSWPASISASLLEPKDGHFVVIFCGSTPRAVLSSYSVGVSEDKPVVPPTPSINSLNVDVSMKATVDETGKMTSAGLRFGGRFDKNIFANASSYGVIIMSSEELEPDSIADCYSGGSASEFIQLIQETGFQNLCYDFKDTSVLVDETGKVTPNGEYIQFGLVVSDVLGHELFHFKAVIYVEIDGVVYFTNEVNTSFIEVANDYLDSTTITEAEELLLKNIIASLE